MLSKGAIQNFGFLFVGKWLQKINIPIRGSVIVKRVIPRITRNRSFTIGEKIIEVS